MDATRHLPLTGLEWKQPSAFNRAYELRMGDEVIARLVFQKVFGTLALAEWGKERWEFERHGFLRPRVVVRRPEQEEELAWYEPHWTGRKGVLHGPGPRERPLCANNLLATHYTWKDEQGEPLLSLRTKGLLHSGAELTVAECGAGEEDIVLLILLGWYVVRLAKQDAAAGAAG